jgi:hypothetical protein
LASTREQSESTDILPRPELNPLLNPILSENMGRWAEVYFTSPPEKREEAVIELLHELEKEKATADTDPAGDPAALSQPARSLRFEPRMVHEQQSDHKFCESCGSENPVTHQFCGMCGAKLHPASSAPEFVTAGGRDVAAPRSVFAQERAAEHVTPEESYEPAPYDEARDSSHAPAFHAPAAGSDELSLFQSFRSPEPDEEWDYEPPSSTSYRFYIAAVLLIVIGALGYLAWRGAQSSQGSHEVSPPPPAPVTESSQPSAPAQQATAPQPTAPAEQTTPPRSTHEATASTSAPVDTPSSPKNRAAEREVAEKTPSAAPAEPAASQLASPSGGVEELAMAERYLNGSAGNSRNSSEAAAWLWRSIAKHNGQATMLLADLYLRGDGVSKNCEQGRVLLDSAARRGIAGAGERLRNLQAFGCH